MLYWRGVLLNTSVWAGNSMAVSAYILPFPEGAMGFVDGDAARLPVRGGRLTVEVYGPSPPTETENGSLRARLLEAVASLVRTEGAHAAAFAPRLWWLLGGISSAILLAVLALASGLPTLWLVLVASGLALPGGLGATIRGWRARRLLRRAERLREVDLVPGSTQGTVDRVAAIWQVAGRLRGSAAEILEHLESHCWEAQWPGPAQLYGHHRQWLEQGAALTPGLPGLRQRWRARLLGGAPDVPIIAVPVPARQP